MANIKATISNSDVAQDGDMFDIQTGIDYASEQGGGIVFIRNGTYLMSSDITLASNITIEGESPDGVIIDFQDQNYQLKANGTELYSTGTISINNNSNTVTGSSTAWDSSMEGESIMIQGSWYIIDTVNSTTELLISGVFPGDSTTGINYSIANPLSNISLLNLTIQNSTHSSGAIDFEQVASTIYWDHINIYTSTLGFKLLDASVAIINNYVIDSCNYGADINRASLAFDQGYISACSVGAGLTITDMYNAQLINFAIVGGATNGLVMTGCGNAGIINFAIQSNTGIGIEMTNCFEIGLIPGLVNNSGSDGIKLVSGCDRNTITNFTIKNSGGYGLNIAASSNDNNIVLGNIFASNSSGAVNDSGTTTKIRSNIGVADN